MEENNNTFRKNAANVFRKIKAIGNSSLKVADRAATFATKAVEEKISGGVEFVDFSLLQQNDVYTGEFFDNVNSDNTDAPDSHYIQEICNPYDIDNHQEDIEELSDSINYFNNCNNLQENLQQNNPVPLDPVLSLNYAFGPNGAEAIPRNAIKITSIITENNNISSTTTFHVLPKTKIAPSRQCYNNLFVSPDSTTISNITYSNKQQDRYVREIEKFANNSLELQNRNRNSGIYVDDFEKYKLEKLALNIKKQARKIAEINKINQEKRILTTSILNTQAKEKAFRNFTRAKSEFSEIVHAPLQDFNNRVHGY